MKPMQIKGLCENCGFTYEGTIESRDGSFVDIKCPNCHEVTHNFDENRAVDELNKAEGNKIDYKASVFEIVQ
jgi:phage FluMu protein Com